MSEEERMEMGRMSLGGESPPSQVGPSIPDSPAASLSRTPRRLLDHWK